MSRGLRLASQYVVEDDAIVQCSQARRALVFYASRIATQSL
jgi:hypothetical protein